MAQRKLTIIAIGSLFVLLALGATACSGAMGATSTPPAPATVQPLPTITPTPAPTPVPAPAVQAKPPKNPRAGRGLEALLKATGLKAGIVNANENGMLSLGPKKNSESVQTNASTIVVIPGRNNATVSDIHAGDRVAVRFSNDDSTKPAAFLLDFPADYRVDNLVLGAVQSDKRTGLTLRTPSGAQNLTTNADTRVVNLSGAQPALGSLADLQPGNAVVVIGKADGAAVNAQVIVLVEKDARALLKKAGKNQPTPEPTPKPGS